MILNLEPLGRDLMNSLAASFAISILFPFMEHDRSSMNTNYPTASKSYSSFKFSYCLSLLTSTFVSLSSSIGGLKSGKKEIKAAISFGYFELVWMYNLDLLISFDRYNIAKSLGFRCSAFRVK